MRGRPVAVCPLQPCSTRSRTSRERHRARHPVHSDGGCTRSTSRCPRGAEVTSPQVSPDAADESGCRPSYVLRTVCEVPTRHPRGQGDCDRKCQPLLLRVGRAVRQASRGTAGDNGLRWAMARCERGRWLMTRSCNRSPPPLSDPRRLRSQLAPFGAVKRRGRGLQSRTTARAQVQMAVLARRHLVHGIEALVAVIPVTPVPALNSENDGTGRPPVPDPGSRGHIGWVVAGSLATGLLAALLLVRRPVHPGAGERRHRRSPVRIRAGLDDVGRALGAVHRSATAMGRGSRAVHGGGRSSAGGVRLLGARGAQLGVASRRCWGW